MIDAACIHPDHAAFRQVVEDVGLLRRDCPVPTDVIGTYFEHFYDMVRKDEVITYTPEYASATVRALFDRDTPVAQWATLPSQFVIIQRINLGLMAILAKLGATGNYRRISEEIWPMVSGPPSTPLGQLEASWLASRV